MTEKNTNGRTELDALERAFERFGSDRTRWPAPVRREFAGLLAGDAEAQQRLREAEALDRLLDLAPPPGIDTRALADRILAAAVADKRVARPAPAAAKPAPLHQRRAWGGVESQWPAAALLAASLVLGMFTGISGSLNTAVAPLMVASTTGESEIDPGQIAFDGDALSLFEEDML
jgi:hypothetical protein